MLNKFVYLALQKITQKLGIFVSVLIIIYCYEFDSFANLVLLEVPFLFLWPLCIKIICWLLNLVLWFLYYQSDVDFSRVKSIQIW